MAKKIKLTPDTVISRNQTVMSTEIDGESILMSIESGKYYGLEPVATRIWEILANPVSFKDLQRILLDEYETTAEQCEKDVRSFLDELEKNKMIILNDQ